MENNNYNNEQTNLSENTPEPQVAVKKPSIVKRVLAWVLIPLAIIIAFAGGFFSRSLFISEEADTAANIVSLIQKVGCIYDPVTGEEIELDAEDFADVLVSGILDKYSAYYTEEELITVTENASGKYSGVGIGMAENGEILEVAFNSPAELSGVKVGDIAKSVTVNGETVLFSADEGDSFTQIIRSAPTGTTIKLTVTRSAEEKHFDIVKSDYIASYVRYKDNEKSLDFRAQNGVLKPVVSEGGSEELKASPNTAYIQFTQFNGDASQQMKEALDFMRERGKTKLILDLRDNGGGYLNILQDIASYFIYNNGAKNSLVSYAEGKDMKLYSYTRENAFYQNVSSIAVLANENTASASECLIGAMLYYKDAFDNSKLIIEKNGEGVARTYGKGIMQSTYTLKNGGALKLTTAKIYHPDKTSSIHGVGFRPTDANAVAKGEAIARAIDVLA